MHDQPGIYPTLPKRDSDPDMWALTVEPSRGTPWEHAWEFVMTHELSDREGSAFWHGAHLVHQAMTATGSAHRAVGICGDRLPEPDAPTPTRLTVCGLPAGHPGWHHGDGVDWSGPSHAEAKVARVEKLLALYDSWDGSRPHPGESSPAQRAQLRAALEEVR